MLVRATQLFPLLALVAAGVAYVAPARWVGLQPAIVPLLMLVMLGMGMTLGWEDLRAVRNKRGALFTGVALQYLVMSAAAFGIARAFDLDLELTAGMILVGSSAGGTASNVICYLADGDLALSVAMTALSTVLAVLFMPALTWLYLGQAIPVPAGQMVASILQIVLVPVLLGVGINRLLGARLAPMQRVFPLFSILAIVIIIAIIVALNRGRIEELGAMMILPIALHNLFGLGCGYLVPKALRFDERTCRTIAIEVGMQNSGLSVALAVQYFSAAAALPGAIFSVWHNLSGAVLASYWGGRRSRR